MWWEKESGSPPAKHPAPIRTPRSVPRLDKLNMDKVLGTSSSLTVNQSTAVLGRALTLHGELSGDQDLLIEGQFEGSINLQGHCLTVGPDAQIQANIQASRAIIHGSVKGNISAREKVEIRRTAHVVGDLTVGGVIIEDGASLKGSIEITRDNALDEPRGLAPSAVSTASRQNVPHL